MMLRVECEDNYEKEWSVRSPAVLCHPGVQRNPGHCLSKSKRQNHLRFYAELRPLLKLPIRDTITERGIYVRSRTAIRSYYYR